MSDLSFNLLANKACSRAGGEYYAQIYLHPSTRLAGAEHRQIALGKRQPRLEPLSSFLDQVFDMIPIHRRDKLIGMSVLRLCDSRPHKRQQLERVAAFGFALPDSTLPIKQHTLHTEDGIGSALCSIEGTGLLHPIIDFPITMAEQTSNLPLHVAEASISRPGQPAYIAVRGLERLVYTEEFHD